MLINEQLKTGQDLITYFSQFDLKKQKDRNIVQCTLTTHFMIMGHGKFYNVYCASSFSPSCQEYVIKYIKGRWQKCIMYCQVFPKPQSRVGKYFLHPIWVSSCRRMIIQPKADTSQKARLKAQHLLTGKIEWRDNHLGNFGMYNDNPCVIDFSHRDYGW